VPLGFGQVGRPPVLVMVSGYSQIMTARMIPSRQSPDLLAGHWTLISGWALVMGMLHQIQFEVLDRRTAP
jgi:hypothetical protein